MFLTRSPTTAPELFSRIATPGPMGLSGWRDVGRRALFQFFLGGENRKWCGRDFTLPVPETFVMVDGRRVVGVVGATRARCWCVLFLRAEGSQGALPDEMYEDRGASFVGQANTLKEIYVSSCKCVRQAHPRHAATLPAGRHVDLRFCRGFDGKLGRWSQNHLSPPSLRLRTAPRTASIAGCH